MEFYEKYDMEAIKNDLQKKLKVMDWDIDLKIISGLEMQRVDDDADGEVFGLCERWRKLREANIYLNYETRDESNFLTTLIHEMLHIVTDDYCKEVNDIASLITNEDTKKMVSNRTLLEYERMVDAIAKSFVLALPYDYLEQFLKEGDKDGEGEEPVRRKRSKDTLH